MLHKTDILIIGGGPAGITFANRMRKYCPEKSVTMLRPEPYSMVYCAIPYAIEGLFAPEKTFKRDELVTDNGVDLIRRRAESVDLRERTAVDEMGEMYSAETIFLATGASPVLPGIVGADAANSFTIKTQKDMERILERIRRGARRAVVVGAGAIGIEQAQAYAARGIETTLVDMASQVLPMMVDAELAQPLHQALTKLGIRLELSTMVSRLEVQNGLVSSVVFSNGEEVALDPERDFVCFSIGMTPDVDLFVNQGLDIRKDGIVVDAQMRTTLPGVFAAGDCCAGLSFLDGAPIGGKLATNAVPMAKVAAAAVAGKSAQFEGFINGAATCVGSWRVGSAGFSEQIASGRGWVTVSGTAQTTDRFPMMPEASPLRVKMVADEFTGRILGGQVLSASPVTDKVDLISLAIAQRMTLADLVRLNYSAQPWQSFFPAKNALVEACEFALAQRDARRPDPACVVLQ